jgi:hypothetical protein
MAKTPGGCRLSAQALPSDSSHDGSQAGEIARLRARIAHLEARLAELRVYDNELRDEAAYARLGRLHRRIIGLCRNPGLAARTLYAMTVSAGPKGFVAWDRLCIMVDQFRLNADPSGEETGLSMSTVKVMIYWARVAVMAAGFEREDLLTVHGRGAIISPRLRDWVRATLDAEPAA